MSGRFALGAPAVLAPVPTQRARTQQLGRRAAARQYRQHSISVGRRPAPIVRAGSVSAPAAEVDFEQARRDWDQADVEAETASASFDEVAARPKIVCFRTKRVLDLTIKEPLGPDMKPKWPIENYMKNPNYFVRLGSICTPSVVLREGPVLLPGCQLDRPYA